MFSKLVTVVFSKPAKVVFSKQVKVKVIMFLKVKVKIVFSLTKLIFRSPDPLKVFQAAF